MLSNQDKIIILQAVGFALSSKNHKQGVCTLINYIGNKYLEHHHPKLYHDFVYVLDQFCINRYRPLNRPRPDSFFYADDDPHALEGRREMVAMMISDLTRSESYATDYRLGYISESTLQNQGIWLNH